MPCTKRPLGERGEPLESLDDHLEAGAHVEARRAAGV